MISIAVALVLTAAVLHAGWNVLLKAQDDPLTMARRACLVSTGLWTPAALIAWLASGRPPFPPTAWQLAGASAVLELFYFAFLSSAYRRGTLSSVYSVARGTAPVLAVLAGVVILGERLSLIEVVGVVALLAGLWVVRPPRAAGSATLPAVLTGVTIAAYSAVDSQGVHVAAPWLYGFVVWALTTALLTAFVPVRRRLTGRFNRSSTTTAPAEIAAAPSTGLGEAGIIGLLMTSTYLIILLALRLAPLAIVSPLRESAIVLVTLWGMWRLHERDHMWMRLGGATAIAAGATLVAIG